jgi:short subunit dehydrogenase-like uncharacterized protein
MPGTHCVDPTGEIPSCCARVIDALDTRAQAGIDLVQVCGFEALPPDLAGSVCPPRKRASAGPRVSREADLAAQFRGILQRRR